MAKVGNTTREAEFLALALAADKQAADATDDFARASWKKIAADYRLLAVPFTPSKL